MVVRLDQLSEEEMDVIARIARVTTDEMFGPIEQWFASNRDRLTREHPGKCIIVNSRDRTYTVGDSFDVACKLYIKKYGPIPHNGWQLIGTRLVSDRK